MMSWSIKSRRALQPIRRLRAGPSTLGHAVEGALVGIGTAPRGTFVVV